MSFTNTLKKEELELLRNIVRKTHQHFAFMEKKFGKMSVTNAELDKLIDNIGPEVAERMIKFGVDKGLR